MEKFFLLHVSTFWLGVGMVLLGVAASLLGLVLVRRSVEVRRLQPQHDVAGFIIAVVGVIYAVLLAFMVVVQWEQYSSASSTAATEAVTLGNLYRDAAAFGTQGRPLARAVVAYSKEVVQKEYPSVSSHQEEDPHIDHYLNAMWKGVRSLPASDPNEQAFVRQAVADVSGAAEARRTRIEDSSSLLPTPMWVVLLVGGALTVGFTYFFGLERFAIQAAMVSTLAVIISLSLFVILVLDLPFTGDIAVQPSALKAEINEFCSYNFVDPNLGSNCKGG